MTESAAPLEVTLPAEIVPPPESPPAAKVALLAAARKRYEYMLRRLTQAQGGAGMDVEFVHDVRVASRRLGEVARLLGDGGGFMDKMTHKAVEGSLKSLRQAMGDLRDLDVAREHLLKWRMPALVKAEARALAAELEQKRVGLEEVGRTQVASASVSGTMVVLARVLEEQDKPENAVAAEQKLEQVAEQQARKRHKQMRQAFGRAVKKQTPAALHEARIAIKKLRYVLELQQEAKKGLKQQVKELKRLQELLGEHHDVHVIAAAMGERVHKTGLAQPAMRRKLGVAWRQWQRDMERGQAERAAAFFVKSYQWMNR